MKPVSASEILRKSAPRDIVGQTFLHVNRYESLRDSLPASSVRHRSHTNALSKRKIADHDDFEDEESSNRSKVIKLDDKEEEELVILDSKISKVSTVKSGDFVIGG